jgi:hypothetical protein
MICCSGITFVIFSLGSTNLFDHYIDFVTVFHVELFGGLGFVESLTIEEESYVVNAQLG